MLMVLIVLEPPLAFSVTRTDGNDFHLGAIII